MSSLSTVAIIALALLIAAALFLIYEIGRLVGEKTTADKFPEAKNAARAAIALDIKRHVRRTARSLSSVPPRRNSLARRSTSWSSKAWTRNTSRK